jgi:hypothetical protein
MRKSLLQPDLFHILSSLRRRGNRVSGKQAIRLGTKSTLSSLLMAVIGLIASCGFVRANDIYFAPTAAGSNNGSSCANAYAYNNSSHGWNVSGNWTGGTNLHICSGTYTGALNGTLMTAGGSGASGNPINIYTEGAATFTSPAWNGLNVGAVNLGGQSWINFCGTSSASCGTPCASQSCTTNLTITNSANGDGLANKQISQGVYANGCNNCTIENVAITNIYVAIQNYSSPLGGNAVQMNAITFDGQNVSIVGNLIHDCGWCLYDAYNNGDTNHQIYGNYIYNWDHAMMFATGTANSQCTAPCLKLHDNQFGSNINWETSGCVYHLDGLHTFGTTGTTMDGIYIYNNYFFGSLSGACSSGFLFIEGGGSSTPSNAKNVYVWNNIGDATGADSANANGWFGLFSASVSMLVANNTLLYNNANDLTSTWSVGGASGGNVVNNLTFENNVVNGSNVAMTVPQTGALSGTTTINYNFYGDACGHSNNCFNWLDSFTGSFSAWKTHCSCDGTNSTTATYSGALLNLDGSPQTGSPVIGIGVNLTSIATGNLATLASDTTKGGTRTPTGRAPAGAWTIGAYTAADVTVGAPNAPTSLTASVN